MTEGTIVVLAASDIAIILSVPRMLRPFKHVVSTQLGRAFSIRIIRQFYDTPAPRSTEFISSEPTHFFALTFSLLLCIYAQSVYNELPRVAANIVLRALRASTCCT